MQIAVVVVTKRPKMDNNIIENFRNQILTPDMAIISTDGFEPDDSFAKQLRDMKIENVICRKSKKEHFRATQRRIINICARKIENGMICVFDDDDWYGPKYLLQVKEMKEANPDAIIIGKDSCHVSLVRNDIEFISKELFICGKTNGTKVRQVAEATICIDVEHWRLWKSVRFRAFPEGAANNYVADVYKYWLKETYGPDSDIHKQWADKPYGIPPPDFMPWAPFYTTGPEEFYFRRFCDPQHEHTWNWNVPQSMFMTKKERKPHGLNFLGKT